MRWLSYILLSLLLVHSQAYSADEEEEEEEKTPIGYANLSPSLVANLSAKRYIRCDVQLMTKDEEQLEDINLHAPALRHELLLLLSEQNRSSLKTAKGKAKLQKDALAALRAVLKEETGEELVDGLYFTTFLVQ